MARVAKLDSLNIDFFILANRMVCYGLLRQIASRERPWCGEDHRFQVILEIQRFRNGVQFSCAPGPYKDTIPS